MSERVIHFITGCDDGTVQDKVIDRAKADYHVINHWSQQTDDCRVSHYFLIDSVYSQPLIDLLQPMLDMHDTARITVLPAEFTLPKVVPADKDKEAPRVKRRSGIGRISREELYNNVAGGAELNANYLLLVFFSTVVAAVGLLGDDIAVIVGAMVIAPFLGPNLALSLATSLGDKKLIWQAAKTGLIGVSISVCMGMVIGMFWPDSIQTVEIMRRTEVGFGAILLALSAGAAAVLSLTKGVSSVLVGVMVAAALLPPVTTCGVMLGAGEFHHAEGAAVLFAVNIACINIAANLVFLSHGIRPQRWYDKEKARRGFRRSLIFWVIALCGLSFLILTRQEYFLGI